MMTSALKKVVGVAALAFIALVSSGCYTYEVKMSYECIQPPTEKNGMCLQWQQIGGVKTPTTCFPKDATVTTRTGPKSMADLSIGDSILGVDEHTGKQVFSTVRAWLHRDANAETTMLAVTGKEGTLVSSPRHLLANIEGEGKRYDFANELKEGSMLLRHDNSKMTITSTSATQGHGLYAPLTETNNYYVRGPQMTTSVLASCYAEIRRPELWAGILQRLISTTEFFFPHISDVHDKNAPYFHPVITVLMKLFPFLYHHEQPMPEKVVV